MGETHNVRFEPVDLEIEVATVRAALYSDLHVELPPGLDLASPDLAGDTHEAIERAERFHPES